MGKTTPKIPKHRRNCIQFKVLKEVFGKGTGTATNFWVLSIYIYNIQYIYLCQISSFLKRFPIFNKTSNKSELLDVKHRVHHDTPRPKIEGAFGEKNVIRNLTATVLPKELQDKYRVSENLSLFKGEMQLNKVLKELLEIQFCATTWTSLCFQTAA